MLAVSNVSNLTFPLNMYGMFPACLRRTHLSFTQHKTLSLLLFCLFTPFLVWNEKLVTSSHRRQLFRKLNSRHCLFLMHCTCLESKNLWEGNLFQSSVSCLFLALCSKHSYTHCTCIAYLLKEVTLICDVKSPFNRILINICRCFIIRKT